MRRYNGIILLFLTLLAISRGAPSSDPKNGNPNEKPPLPKPAPDNETSTEEAVILEDQPTQAVHLTKAPLSSSQLIQQIKPVFDSMPLETLKQLRDSSSSGKVEEFEGILMELYEGQDAEKVFTLIDNLKNHFGIVSAMLRGAILKKQNDIRKAQTEIVPTEDKEQQATNKGSQQIASQIDDNTEKIVLKDLFNALKDIPSKDLKRVRDANPIKPILTMLQSGAAPDLSDELIAYGASHVANLQNTIDVILDGREELESMIVTSSVAGRAKTILPSTVAKESDKLEPGAPADNSDNKDDLIEPADQGDGQTEPASQDDDQTEPANQDDDQTEPANQDGDQTEPANQDGDQTEPANQDDDQTEPAVPDDDDDDDPDLTDIYYNKEDLDTDTDNKAGGTFENTKKPEKPETNFLGKDAPNEETRTVSGGGWFGMWHFLIIFLVIAGIVGTVYVCSHNRKKIREGVGAYIADAASRGRRNRNYRYKPVSST